MNNIGIIESKYRSCASLAIQCLEETGIVEHDEAFKHHVQNAKTLGLMPDDLKVIKATLADYGFVMQSRHLEDIGFINVVAVLRSKIDTPSTVLITLRNHQHMGGYMIALQMDSAHRIKIICPDLKPKNMGWCTVTHVWIRWSDGLDRSPFPRKAVNRHVSNLRKREYKDTDSYRYFNPNPCSNFIGDCVVRAFAGVLDITWNEALDRLASSGETTVNAQTVYQKILEREGFTHHKPLTRDGHRLDGKEFCVEMDRQYRKGECIFAHLGRSHAVAIVPVDGHYRVIDAWDSTSRTIGDFWVKTNGKPNSGTKTDSYFALGDSLQHPSFGVGVVTAVVPGVVTIDFGVNGLHRLGAAWVANNCIRMTV